MHVKLPGHRECEVFVTLASDKSGDRALDVERMFDARGEEAFDPTDAVECEVDGALRVLTLDDEITIRVRVGARPSQEG